MEQAVRDLARARAEVASASQKVKEIEKEIAESDAGSRLHVAKMMRDDAKNVEILRYDLVRTVGLDVYNHTGEKSPHPAVKVGIHHPLFYAEEEALAYCHKSLPAALKLDKKVFEKAAEAIKPAFVTFGEEPRVRVSRDLSEWLEAKDE